MKRNKFPQRKPVEPRLIATASDGAKKILYDGYDDPFIAYDDCPTCHGTGWRLGSLYSMYQSKRQCDECEGRYNHDPYILKERGKALAEQAERLYRGDKKQNGTDKASFAETFQFDAIAREYRQIVKWIWNGAPEPAPFMEVVA